MSKYETNFEYFIFLIVYDNFIKNIIDNIVF
jgi:hypothetical protein